MPLGALFSTSCPTQMAAGKDCGSHARHWQGRLCLKWWLLVLMMAMGRWEIRRCEAVGATGTRRGCTQLHVNGRPRQH
eukprot:1881261-Alexandrium_andersonii.AAC.1